MSLAKQQYDILIIGGGAAGFFTAINIAEKHPSKSICILEGGREVLTKLRRSGGGRCNVTNAEQDPKELVKNYPRGHKELLGPFHRFGPRETVQWFAEHGVQLHTEADGRMFPVTNRSETIINCFTETATRLGITVQKEAKVTNILPPDTCPPKLQQRSKGGSCYEVQTTKENYRAEKLILTTGSNPMIWKMLEQIGHKIVPPVPSLFTFQIQDNRLEGLQGLSTTATLQIPDTKLQSEGPLLITHWGLSGPAVLRLSAWGARVFAEQKYRFSLEINWLGKMNREEAASKFKEAKHTLAKKNVTKACPFDLPARLWTQLVLNAGIALEKKWAELSKKELGHLAQALTVSVFQVDGKTPFKDEFVTAGGVDLKEVDFKTMESKLHKNLFFAGEVLDVDAVTGGFNFQNAWTGGWLVAESIE